MQEQVVRRVLDMLSGGGDAFSQQDRLLVLSTSLGPNELLAERAEVVEGIAPLEAHVTGTSDIDDYLGCRIRLTALSQRADIVLPDLLGQPVLLQLLTADSRTELRPFHGIVTHFELLGSDNGLARYELVAQPWLRCLQWRSDSYVYQDMTVVEIVEAVFGRYAGQGQLAPAWRWNLADREVYPRRSRCVQHAESDLRFICRLLAEEGIFFAIEHEGDISAPGLGRHTVVFFDDNGGFEPARQPVLRLTHSQTASFSEDGLQRWDQRCELVTDSISLISHDYRSCDPRPVGAETQPVGDVSLSIHDVPGAYAYEDLRQGQRLAQRWLEARRVPGLQWQGRSTVRSLAPLRRFEVANAPDGERGPFVATALTHHARSNLSADAQAQLQHTLGPLPSWARSGSQPLGRRANASMEPLYQLDIVAQQFATPVRAPATALGVLARPTVHGIQTAIVVGEGPVHTDRDHRIKLQHHWQRGGVASHGLESPFDDNAPASDASSTWVAVAEPLAGPNFGSNFIPRVGQEVATAFLQGDIDRPIVIGAVHNGVGHAQANRSSDGQGNQVLGGQGGATGNAPQWFPGQQTKGELDAHNHPAALEGYKSQSLGSSASGAGGYSQWVQDNTPGGNRIEVSTTSFATRFQLGRLRHQNDNQLLQPRGHGFDLATQARGALRAGAGLLLSAHGRLASTNDGQQMDVREPSTSLQRLSDLGITLAQAAQQHLARREGEPEPKKLPTFEAQQALYDSLQGRTGASGDDGGLGEYIQWTRPDLLMSAPAGIAWLSPATQYATAGGTICWTAGDHVNVTAQGHHASIVAQGLAWFTQGKSSSAEGPQETGIRLHAATGSVDLQANTAKALLAADKRVDVVSTGDAVKVDAPEQVLLNGGGSALQINSGGITITTGGPANFKAALKELTGAASASASLNVPQPVALKGCPQKLADACGSGDPFLTA